VKTLVLSTCRLSEAIYTLIEHIEIQWLKLQMQANELKHHSPEQVQNNHKPECDVGYCNIDCMQRGWQQGTGRECHSAPADLE
jgi:hypothetical protein